MRISIIVPVYNNSPDLAECIAALRISCLLPDPEIIVVDDASTDDTALTALELGVRVLKLATNSGPAAARNYGARHAQGGILFFVDADVVLASRAFSRLEKVFEEQPDLAAVLAPTTRGPRRQA